MEIRLAREIMGRNFVGTQDIERMFGVWYPRRERSQLKSVPFSEDMLRECAETHILLPGFSMTINEMLENQKLERPVVTNLTYKEKDLRALEKSIYLYSNEWTSARNNEKRSVFHGHPFMSSRVSVRWYLLRKLPSLPNQDLLKQNERVASLCDAVYGVVVTNLLFGEILFPHTGGDNSYVDPSKKLLTHDILTSVCGVSILCGDVWECRCRTGLNLVDFSRFIGQKKDTIDFDGIWITVGEMNRVEDARDGEVFVYLID